MPVGNLTRAGSHPDFVILASSSRGTDTESLSKIPESPFLKTTQDLATSVYNVI